MEGQAGESKRVSVGDEDYLEPQCDLEREVKRIHRYDVPEFIALPIVADPEIILVGCKKASKVCAEAHPPGGSFADYL